MSLYIHLSVTKVDNYLQPLHYMNELSGYIPKNKLISKNQALTILYLKHHVYKKLHKLSWIRNLTKSQKFDTHEINNHTIQYKILQHNKTQA